MQQLTYPLHPAQWDVYTDQLLNVESPHYNIGGYIKLKGSLDNEKFKEAVCSAPATFDVFRMRFDTNLSESPCYYEEDYQRCEMPELDFSQGQDPEGEATAFMQNRFNTAFVVHKDSLLFEHFLIKISPDEHWAFGRYHHLIIDGYGFIAWAQYVALKYKSLVQKTGERFEYPSYRKESERAAEYYKSTDYESHAKYWKERIAEKPERLLQRKNLFQSSSGKKSSTYTLQFSEDQRRRFHDIQVATNAGLQQLTIAALLIYYGKISGQSEFIIGTPVHKRVSRELRKTIGMFAGILAYKGSFQTNIPLENFIKDITQTQKRDYRHQHYLIGDLSRQLKLHSLEGYLCEIIVNYELLNFDINFGDDIQSTVCRLLNEFETDPLQISWQDYGPTQPMQLQVHFLHEYFSPEEVELLVERILFILQQFPASLHDEIGSIDILPSHEQQLIQSFNNTAISYPGSKTIVDLFEEQATATPGAIAAIFENDQLTYKELNERSNQLARLLRHHGVAAETLVPIFIERSIEMIVGLLGILKAGGAYVPIDPSYPEDRIRYMLTDTKGKLVITSSRSRSALPQSDEVQLIELDTEWITISKHISENLQVPIQPRQLAYIIYTSGSTGRPKGTMIEHRNVSSFIRWCRQEFASSRFDIVYAGTSICFDLSVYEIFYTLSVGKPIRILENGLSIEQYLASDTNILTNSVPTVIQHLLKEGADLTNISVMNMAGEPIPFHVHQQLDADRIEIRNLYGPTEDTTYSTVYRLRNGGPILIGHPISNTQVYIVSKHMQIMPLGVTGEICLGGEGLARGYLNKPDLTAEKFIRNPFSNDPEARLYRTGDLGRWLPNGNIEYQGRMDDQVKVRGFRIELGEIETVLRQYDLVSEAIVVAREDRSGAKQLVGYVILDCKNAKKRESELSGQDEKNDLTDSTDSDTSRVIETDIKSWLQQRLPEYMIPALIVQLDQLPLTPNGKIDKKALPDPESTDPGNEYVAPGNVLEEKLVEIWKEVLDVDRIGVYDNFFDLGGHSLKAIQLISRLHKRLHVKIDIAKILANPTIHSLAKVLELEKAGSFTSIPRLPEQEYYELSHAQKRIWVVSCYDNSATIYNSPGAYLVEGNLDVPAFSRAFELLIQRHESLRTVFIMVDGEPKQKILQPSQSGFSVSNIDLRGKADSDTVIKRWLEEETSKTFNLEKGPLMRAALFQTASDRHVLAFNIHHIISDGWSKGILIKEFLELYKGVVTGIQNELSPLPIQYKDYAAWHAVSFSSQQNFWKQLYENDIPVLDLPTDFDRPRLLSFNGGMLDILVSGDVTEQLQKIAARHGSTLNNLLFALYGLVLAKYSRQDDIVVGSLVSGRSHADLENLVGVFINFLPVRLFPRKESSFKEYFSRTHQSLTEAYSNQDYPFDLMVDRFVKKRDVSRNPFFDTMVNFHSENDIQRALQPGNGGPATGGLTLKPLELSKKDQFESTLDFKLDIEVANRRLVLNLSYNSRLFSEKRMKEFFQEYVNLLSEMTHESDFILADYLGPDPQKQTTLINEGKQPELLNNPLSVTICSSFVAEPLQEYIDYWSGELSIDTKVNFAPYNQVFQQLLNMESALLENTGINVLLLRVEDWLRDQPATNGQEQIAILKQTYAELIHAIGYAQKNSFVPYLVGIVPLKPFHSHSDEVAGCIRNLSENLEQFVASLPRFYLLNLPDIASLYSVEDLFDDKSDELGHIPFTQEYYAALGTYIMRKIRAYKGPLYKVIVLDCDNTLWKGVCGEVGPLDVIIDDNHAYLQEFLLEKYSQGFLIALCSKNNEEDVWEVFEKHPGMKIKREHIAAYQINWNPKPGNLVALSQELNLGLNSMVFIDDSEFEIEQTTLGCPDVLSLALPENEPGSFPGFINHVWALDHFQVTEEDLKRNSMYKAEKERKEEQVKFSSLNDFLQSLNIKVSIRPLEEEDMERAVQLTLRTNQFNLNGIHKSYEEIAKCIGEPGCINWIIEVKDRFGDYGIAGLVLARKSQTTLVVETFLLSCRVLGRNVEEAVLTELRNYCIVHGLDNILALYQKTPKNKPFTSFLLNTDWQLDAQTNVYSFFIKSAQHELISK